MDTKDTAETGAPSVAPAKPAQAPEPAGGPEPEEPVLSVPLSGLRDDSPLRAALISLQYPPQQPLHCQPHIQLHPHPQPFHLWLRV